ncbi:MAG: diaminopimelate epimerase [Gammaproteobacteria bacterium]|nr:diaminopimelate epimerase [Gammaproteobacteria bacterium]
MVVRWPAGKPAPDPALVRQWADRRLGVGFDQLLLVDGGEPGVADAGYRIFNRDGGEVEQCGNGARCIARFVASGGAREADAAAGTQLRLASAAGPIEARIEEDGHVSVNLGVPDFNPESLPFVAERESDRYTLALAAGSVEFGAVSLGNPHAVIEVDSVDAADVGILGPELETHAAFPKGVNVGFVEFVDSEAIRLRVHERGVGETLACGTGAAAAVAVGRRWGRLAERVSVVLRGGKLSVRWAGPGSPLWQSGPTTMVYEGQIEL